ncbi:hypothetical protein NIASO_04950 [Niabella soli DSM 19437]|uniref:Uncharacterized protein n=1 Tax=Niabella soli DSM 19437 TaxID=929713 RepID=W0F744_9BACT|nr:hypothetical protein NIASO_04950 [Niabella soli DSM 19437]
MHAGEKYKLYVFDTMVVHLYDKGAVLRYCVFSPVEKLYPTKKQNRNQ